jgi:hypothetical protein
LPNVSYIHMIRILISTCLTLLALSAGAQTDADLNKTDAKGKPHGQWLVRQPARMGEDAYAEWGSYDHGTKTGTWYKFDGEGEVAAIEKFRVGMLDGEAKYFQQGRLVAVGHYRGLNPGRAYDTIFVLDPVTHEELKRVISTDRGTVKHGVWQFYDEFSGRLVREVEYSIDEVIFRQDFSIASKDSAYYKKREAAAAVYPKNYYAPPRGKQVRYTDFK